MEYNRYVDIAGGSLHAYDSATEIQIIFGTAVSGLKKQRKSRSCSYGEFLSKEPDSVESIDI